jgi:hypothetical protein
MMKRRDIINRQKNIYFIMRLAQERKIKQLFKNKNNPFYIAFVWLFFDNKLTGISSKKVLKNCIFTSKGK